MEAESGGGKTRLLDEFGHRAQAEGALVLRGQGVDQAAQHPFEILRGVTQGLGRALALHPTFAAVFDDLLAEEREALRLAAPD